MRSFSFFSLYCPHQPVKRRSAKLYKYKKAVKVLIFIKSALFEYMYPPHRGIYSAFIKTAEGQHGQCTFFVSGRGLIKYSSIISSAAILTSIQVSLQV